MIQIELFGVPRLRAGVGAIEVSASDARQALTALVAACPALGVVLAGDRLDPAYRLSLDAERFLTDLDTPLPDGCTLLLLSADVGG